MTTREERRGDAKTPQPSKYMPPKPPPAPINIGTPMASRAQSPMSVKSVGSSDSDSPYGVQSEARKRHQKNRPGEGGSPTAGSEYFANVTEFDKTTGLATNLVTVSLPSRVPQLAYSIADMDSTKGISGTEEPDCNFKWESPQGR